MQSNFLMLGDARMHYRTVGEGNPVVLAHGFLESSEMWTDFLKEAPDGFQYILPDLPGHGASDVWDHKHTMDMMAGLVERILTHLDIHEPISWIGHSMGGYVGLAFAELFSERTSSLCLFHSQAHADSDQKKRDRLRAVEALRAGKEKFIHESIQNLFAPYNRERLSDEIVHASRTADLMPTEGIIAALLGMRERPDRQKILGTVRRTMTIVGKDDPVIPSNREIETYTDSSVILRVVEQCGHMGHLEQPHEVHKLLNEFLSD
jgi:pimeloyl-ACP methyl ester carboxylesterase